MSDQSDSIDRRAARGSDDDGDFFTVGPPLHAVRTGYLQRDADRELYDSIAAGDDVYLFAPLRSGKTSLIAATTARLRNNGFQVAVLDLVQIGERDAGSDPGRWYYSIAYRLLRQLRIKIDLQAWWQDKSILTSRQRLFEFYLEVLLANTRDPVVIVIDELQAVEDLEVARQLVESITAVNKARVTEPELSRLSFVLSGECDAAKLVPNPELSPFGMMRAVRLENFTREELGPFQSELNLDADRASRALDRIHFWTAGQPYLTQKLSRLLSRLDVGDDVEDAVDLLVQQQFGTRSAVRAERHFAHIHARATADKKLSEATLTTYGRISKGVGVDYEPESQAQRLLITLGLIAPTQEGSLEVTSPLYRLAFTPRWANENLPLHWRGPAAAAALLLLLIAIPFWYTQLLPKPYTRVLTSPSTDLDTAAEAFSNLRSFPGHRDAADRLLANFIRIRASAAVSEGEIARIASMTSSLADEGSFSAELVADFWDRQAHERLQLEDRDGALLATLESLVEPTPERRRLAASLLGADYPFLIGSVSPVDADQAVFDPVNRVLTATSGPQIRQWLVEPGRIDERSVWTATALEVTPLLRRLPVDRPGTVTSVQLTVSMAHRRADDIRARLIAPSGRAAELAIDASRATLDEPLQFRGPALAIFRGEPLSGTWTLSLRDEAPDVAGEFESWTLFLNGRPVVDDLDASVPIPEPLERASDEVWLSADARHAIARTLQSDSVRLWNLAYASPTRTLPIPASERVLAVSADGDRVVTQDGSEVHTWRTGTVGRESSVDVGVAQDVRWLSGNRVLVRRELDTATIFDVYDLATGRRSSRLEVSGEAALSVVNESGSVVAVADYDRAVRLWSLESATVIAQFDLPVQPSSIRLGPGGRTLAASHSGGGFSLWRADRPELPLLTRIGGGESGVAFSDSGGRLIAGGQRQGYQIYRSDDGRAIGAPLDAGPGGFQADLLGFSDDGNIVVTGHADGQVRFWRYPTAASALTPSNARAADGRWWWRDNEDLVANLSPDGQTIAVGDSDGHVHIFGQAEPRTITGSDLDYLGHRQGVVRIVFSPDSRLVASAGLEGSVRVWDVPTGQPRDYVATPGEGAIDAFRFSPSGRYLAALSERRLWMLDTASAETVVDIDLGERHADFSFAADESVFLAAESGQLRQLRPDRLGNWSLANLYQSARPLVRVRAGQVRDRLLLIDDQNVARVYDVANGTLANASLNLPDRVADVLFVANDARVLIRTSRWVHSAAISASGIYWQNAVRLPQLLSGSSLSVESVSAAEPDAPNWRLLMLTRDAGFAEVAEIDFGGEQGVPLNGAPDELLAEWESRLGPAFAEPVSSDR